VHGWPQTWYQWRLVMPVLARDFHVIAVDQRGIGLSDKPQTGYDAGTEANDLVALMEVLGYQRFAMTAPLRPARSSVRSLPRLAACGPPAAADDHRCRSSLASR
jgi:hypothetical protein